MIRFNRRSWILSIRASQLADIDPFLRPAALALQAALVADGLVDETVAAFRLDGGAAAARRASRRCARQARPLPRRAPARARATF
jgi:hypothetical protein